MCTNAATGRLLLFAEDNVLRAQHCIQVALFFTTENKTQSTKHHVFTEHRQLWSGATREHSTACGDVAANLAVSAGSMGLRGSASAHMN